jgi:superfamily II DNA helicase RecQ
MAEVNGFLRSHRVIAVERRWVDQGTESFWCFCVDYLESGSSAGAASFGKGQSGTNRAKVDYREVLSPEDFAVFARLRQTRQEIAQKEGVPVYTIFTNDQLAQLVKGRVTTKAAMEKIGGLGDARIEKYADRMLEILGREWPDGAAEPNAASQPSV